MEITNDFTIGLPPEQAYQLLVDLERVAPCMPGAELGDERPDGSRAVKVRVKLGPMKFVYEGAVSIAEQDEAARRAVLVGTARETRGQGDANATISMQVRPGDGGGSYVATLAQVELSGRAAQMGHGVVQAVSKQLMCQMTKALEQRFAPSADERPPAAEDVPAPAPVVPAVGAAAPAAIPSPPAAAPPVKAGALVFAVVREWLRRLAHRERRA